MFRTVPLSIIRSFHCTNSSGINHTACEQDQDGAGSVLILLASKPVWHIPLLCVQWKIPDDGQRNCPKHVEFCSKKNSEISASSWFYCKKLSRCTITWTSDSPWFQYETYHIQRKVLCCIPLSLLLTKNFEHDWRHKRDVTKDLQQCMLYYSEQCKVQRPTITV